MCRIMWKLPPAGEAWIGFKRFVHGARRRFT
jgi:hypothetical protein